MDPRVRRLAVRVEDHPLEYGSFEGSIPKGEYGAGDVIIWDRGTFEVHGGTSVEQQLASGVLHLHLTGEKLDGEFMLIRTGGDPASRDWLLFHKAEGGIEGWDPEDHSLSVASNRTNEQVAAVREELDALDQLGSAGKWKFAGRELNLTNLDRVIFGDPRDSNAATTTKRDLIRYYASIATCLLPMTARRPLNLHRFPKGVDHLGFWQKAVPSHTPEWIERWDNPDARSGETTTYFVASEPATLAWLANYGVVEMHPWTSTTADPNSPSFAIFDLDPGPRTSWQDLLDLARLHREAIQHLGVAGFPTVSGQRGIQIRVPLQRGVTFDESRTWVEAVSRVVGRVRPDLVSWEWAVANRGGLARLDYTQNARNKTIVAPYSVRPVLNAPIATPIRWEELDDVTLRPDRWTIANIAERIATVGDLMAGLTAAAVPLPSIAS